MPREPEHKPGSPGPALDREGASSRRDMPAKQFVSLIERYGRAEQGEKCCALATSPGIRCARWVIPLTSGTPNAARGSGPGRAARPRC